VFNATFNNISAISSRPILVMEDADHQYGVDSRPVLQNTKGCTRLAAASDKVYQLLAHGWWYSPGTPASLFLAKKKLN
jgi:hypothetical protein